MKFPLTEQLVEEARRFELRSACCHCYFWRGSDHTQHSLLGSAAHPGKAGVSECLHGWPDEGQTRWPLDAADPVTGEQPTEVAFCKEFELR